MDPRKIEMRSLGGIRTVEDIKARCTVEIDGDGREHWLWRMSVNSKCGVPMCVYKQNRMNTRRVSWLLANPKRTLPNGWMAYGACDYPLCVHPACVKVGPRGPVTGRMTRERGVQANTLAALKQSAKRQRKLSDELVLAVAASTESNKATAERLGVGREVVRRIRAGECYADVLARLSGGSVFTMASTGLFTTLVRQS